MVATTRQDYIFISPRMLTLIPGLMVSVSAMFLSLGDSRDGLWVTMEMDEKDNEGFMLYKK
ncbi:hypothetical protein CFIMG_005899RA [Ceratocystis fimbriata CBS 114723]|uniref:Uncharacterized protein n=1 Tax=Ceratocystis fimbriata CBS 114723 TaxID=1035309 RepID=A0A2C5WWE6_9PEZI|nr:hypothetical protein CFIMG_005899RA [Ceratocystis fimbriata CBS 114723]